MKKFDNILEMAMDFQGKPDVWNPQIKGEIESGREEISGVLPSQEYLEAIHSEEYIDLINRITRLTGIREEDITTTRVPSIIARAGAAFSRSSQIESRNAQFFTDLAIKVVLDLEEFSEIKKLYEDGKVKIDISHGQGEMQRGEDVQQELEQQAEEEAEELEDEEETTEMEAEEFDIFQELMSDDDKRLRKRLMNSLMQGNAVNKFQLYHLIPAEEMERINREMPELIACWGLTTTLPQLAYHHAPAFMFPGTEDSQDGEGEDMEGQGAVGSEQVYFDENGIPVIKVRGINFPLLCHELSKGIYELLSYHHKETEIGAHNPKTERKDTLHGTPMWKKFQAMIPADKQSLIPRIYQRFVRLMDDDDIKAVFEGGDRGRQVIAGIIKEIEDEKQKHQDDLESWEREQDEDYDEDRGF